MDLKIDEKMVQESLNKAATKAIENAFREYSVAQVLENEVAGAVISDVLQKSVSSAVAQIDIAKLSTVLAEELSRTVISGVTYMLRASVVEMMLDIKKIPHYESDKREKMRVELEQRIFNKKQQ